MEKQTMQSYRDLIAYQKAYQLSLDIYKCTKNFPKDELFGIVSSDATQCGLDSLQYFRRILQES